MPFCCVSCICYVLLTEMRGQGVDGKRRLEQGPDIKSYRGIRIIHSHSFPINEGEAPRDLLRRRVRVSEFYLLPNCTSLPANWEGPPPTDEQQPHQHGFTGMPRQAPGERDEQAAQGGRAAVDGGRLIDAKGSVRVYDESSDSFVVLRYEKILEQCRRFIARANNMATQRPQDHPLSNVMIPDEIGSVLLLRPNIEHHMLGMIMGKGGSQEDLGATFWGQTELSCFDDGQHGVWGMNYKYHASSLVLNERNLHRMWDIAYDGYVGGKDATVLDWGSQDDIDRFIKFDSSLGLPYSGPSIIVIPLPTSICSLPSPLPIANLVNSLLAGTAHSLATADLFVEDMQGFLMRVAEKIGAEHIHGLRIAISVMYDLLHMHRNSAAAKCAAMATMENEATLVRLAYGGTYHYRLDADAAGMGWQETYGCGHHGPDAVGKASERAGKGFRIMAPPQAIRIT